MHGQQGNATEKRRASPRTTSTYLVRSLVPLLPYGTLAPHSIKGPKKRLHSAARFLEYYYSRHFSRRSFFLAGTTPEHWNNNVPKTCAFIGAKVSPVIMVEIEPKFHSSSKRKHVIKTTHRRRRMLDPSSLPPRWGEGVAPPPTPQFSNTPQVSPESSETTRYRSRPLRSSTNSTRTVVAILVTWFYIKNFMQENTHCRLILKENIKSESRKF